MPDGALNKRKRSRRSSFIIRHKGSRKKSFEKRLDKRTKRCESGRPTNRKGSSNAEAKRGDLFFAGDRMKGWKRTGG